MLQIEMEIDSDCAIIHSEESITYTTETVDKPANCFKNQIILQKCTSLQNRSLSCLGQKQGMRFI